MWIVLLITWYFICICWNMTRVITHAPLVHICVREVFVGMLLVLVTFSLMISWMVVWILSMLEEGYAFSFVLNFAFSVTFVQSIIVCFCLFSFVGCFEFDRLIVLVSFWCFGFVLLESKQRLNVRVFDMSILFVVLFVHYFSFWNI